MSDRLPPLVIGCTFTLLGLAKLYGLARGIEGGANKPISQRLCGT